MIGFHGMKKSGFLLIPFFFYLKNIYFCKISQNNNGIPDDDNNNVDNGARKKNTK